MPDLYQILTKCVLNQRKEGGRGGAEKEEFKNFFFWWLARNSDGNPLVLLSSLQSLISTSLTVDRNYFSWSTCLANSVCLSKQCDWFTGIIIKIGGKREPTVLAPSWTLTSHSLLHPRCQTRRARTSLPPRWTLITVCAMLWDPQMKALVKAKSVITLRTVIGSHLALETDQAGVLNHETKVGQILHLL